MPYAETKVVLPKFTTYTDYELQQFDNAMQYYLEEKTLSNGDIVKIYNEDQFLKDNKALNQDGAVIINVTESTQDDLIKSHAMPAYEILMEKLRQWKMWKGRKEYGQMKRMEGLDNLAKTMTLDKDFTSNTD